MIPKYIVRWKRRLLRQPDFSNPGFLATLEHDQLLSLMLHNCHRIEKAHYNKIFDTKRESYDEMLRVIRAIIEILRVRNELDETCHATAWALSICSSYGELESNFIARESLPRPELRLDRIDSSADSFSTRRSCRVWAAQQLDSETAYNVGLKLIECARWAPNSGNRQAWRFAVVTEAQTKDKLRGLKEEHCLTAPLLIFVGMDRRLYLASRHLEHCLFVDAGAAITLMTVAAHDAGLGTCWNDLGAALIRTRKRNEAAYLAFREAVGIPLHVEPVGLLAVGIPEFVPPTPQRLEVARLLIGKSG